MKKNFIINCLYYILIIFLIVLFVIYVLPVIFPIILGLFIPCLLQPIARFITKHTKLNYKASIFLVISIFYIFLFTNFAIISYNIIYDIKSFSLKIPKIYFETISSPNKFIDVINFLLESLSLQTKEILTEFSLMTAKFISNIAKSLPSIVLNSLLTILSSFLFFFEYDFLHSLFKTPKLRFLIDLKNCILSTFYSLSKSYLTILMVTFSILSICFFIIKIPNCVGLSLLIAFFDILPGIGIGVFLIPWLIFEFIVGNSLKALNLLIIYILCVVVRNIIEPKLLADKIGISPLFTIICMIVCAKVFGIFGAISAPFIIIIIKNFYYLGYFKK